MVLQRPELAGQQQGMDLLMQFGTQQLCSRVVAYFHDDEAARHIFPEHFADEVAELGPLSPSGLDGPCLALFSNVRLAPQQLKDWLAASFVERTCTRVFWLGRDAPALDSREELVRAVVAAPVPAGVSAVRLDAYPKSQEMELGDAILDGGYALPMRPTDFSHVLFVAHLGQQFRWGGLLTEAEVWRHSCTKPALFKSSVARAINKIAEAVQVLGLQHVSGSRCYVANSAALQSQAAAAGADDAQAAEGEQQQQQQQQAQEVQQQAPTHERQEVQQAQQQVQQQVQQAGPVAAPQQQQPRRWAIDVGACPGGWTTYLADCCGFRVIAVDPAELHPDVTSRPNVYAVRAKAEEAMAAIDELLGDQQVDLLVSDINSHPKTVGPIIKPLVARLKPGGWLIVTLKYYGRGRNKHTMPAQLDEFFEHQFEPGRGLWLLANTTCERTYAARRKA